MEMSVGEVCAELHFVKMIAFVFLFIYMGKKSKCDIGIKIQRVFEQQKSTESLILRIFGAFFSKLKKGLEPSTPSLRVKCSTN